MASDDAATAAPPRPTVFLSYATQDREAARALQQGLDSLGLEVWLDESELGGGDAWDQKIRRQIRECQYFMPVVSAQTEARAEGYFRREWRLAVERSLDMADDHLFLLPVAIDDTNQAGARVPEKFLAVQWLKLPGGRPTPALEALCRRIVAGDTVTAPADSKAAPAGSATAAAAPAARRGARSETPFPAYPVKGDREAWAHRRSVALWAAQASWIGFRRLPRWVQGIVWIWLCIALISHTDKSDSDDSKKVSDADLEKIKQIAQQYQGNTNKADIARLGMQIAQELSGETGAKASQKVDLLAVPFVAPSGDAAAAKFADSAFAMTYGRLAVSRKGHVGLSDKAPSAPGLDAAVDLAREGHAPYVLYGTIDQAAAGASLTVTVAAAGDRSVKWSRAYPLAGADASKIAADVDGKVPAMEE